MVQCICSLGENMQRHTHSSERVKEIVNGPRDDDNVINV